MTLKQARELCSRDNMALMAEKIGVPVERWAGQCHSINLELVRSGLLPGRVARGTAADVPSQHSWIVLGEDRGIADPYDHRAVIVDPAIWHCRNMPPQITVMRNSMLTHRPHGAGSIWDYGRPCRGDGPVIGLQGADQLGARARSFLEMLGPLDRRGWMMLAHAPVQGWPAREILTAMHATPGLGVLIPIDHLGMATDLNPGELYW